MFQCLEGDRSVGFDVGFIQSGTIINWLKEVEGVTDAGDINLTVRMVRAIDAEFIATRPKTQPTPSPKQHSQEP